MGEPNTYYGFRFIDDGILDTQKQKAKINSKIFQAKKIKSKKKGRK